MSKMTCAPSAGGGTPGGACSADSQGCNSNGDCCSNKCDMSTMTCAPSAGGGTPGGACLGDFSGTRCSTDGECCSGFCDMALATPDCRPKAGGGTTAPQCGQQYSMCQTVGECCNGLECNTRNFVCEIRKAAIGETCTYDYDCSSNLCSVNKCKQPTENGGTCSQNKDCQSKNCDLSSNTCKCLAGSYMCGAGEECTQNVDCCCGGSCRNNTLIGQMQCRLPCDPYNIEGKCLDGETCESSVACGSSFCDSRVCSTFLCVGDGEPCTYDGGCCRGNCEGTFDPTTNNRKCRNSQVQIGNKLTAITQPATFYNIGNGHWRMAGTVGTNKGVLYPARLDGNTYPQYSDETDCRNNNGGTDCQRGYHTYFKNRIALNITINGAPSAYDPATNHTLILKESPITLSIAANEHAFPGVTSTVDGNQNEMNGYHSHQADYQWPYPDSGGGTVLCISSGAGGADSVVNPLCSREEGTQWGNQKCAAGVQIAYGATGDNAAMGQPAGGNIFGWSYSHTVNIGAEGSIQTVKVKVCSKKTMNMGGSHPNKPMDSPTAVLTFESKNLPDLCEVTDETKCTETRCKPKGHNGINPFDTPAALTARDCTSYEQPVTPGAINKKCSRNSECPTKSCIPMDKTVNVPYPDYINITAIREATYNCTLTPCPPYSTCDAGRCKAPVQNKTVETLPRCESTAQKNTRYLEDPSASTKDTMSRQQTPPCLDPTLLFLGILTGAGEDTVLWPTFSPRNTGPYYVSVGNNSNFRLYARASFVTAIINYTTGQTGFASTALNTGKFSKLLNFADGNENGVRAVITVRGEDGLRFSETEYVVYISRQGADVPPGPVSFSADPGGAPLPYASLAQANKVTSVEYNLTVLPLGKQIKIMPAALYSSAKYLLLPLDQLNSKARLPGLSGSQWADFNTQNSGKVFRLPGCTSYAILVQINGRVLFSFQMHERQSSHTSLLETKNGQKTVIFLNSASVNAYFCSPGKALEAAFTSPLLQGTTKLEIKLAGDLGVYQVSSTLEVMGVPAVLKHVQGVEKTSDGALHVSLLYDHQLTTGQMVTFSTPGQSQLQKLPVDVRVLDSKTVRLKYSTSAAKINDYTFTPIQQSVCFSQVLTCDPNTGAACTQTTGISTSHEFKAGDTVTQPETGGNAEIADIQGNCLVVKNTDWVTKPNETFKSYQRKISAPAFNSFCYSGETCTFSCRSPNLPPPVPADVKQITPAATANIVAQGAYSMPGSFNQITMDADASPQLIGSMMEVNLDAHSCVIDGAIVTKTVTYNSGGTTGGTAGGASNTWSMDVCTGDNEFMTCTWDPNPNRAMIIKLLATNTYVQLTAPIVAAYRGGDLRPVKKGRATATDITLTGIIGTSGKKPIIEPITVGNARFNKPNNLPNRNEDGIFLNDIDTNYMANYHSRLLRISEETARLTISDVTFRRGGICDDVDFDPTHVIEKVNQEDGGGGVAADTLQLTKMEIDPSIAMSATASAASLQNMYCPPGKPRAYSDTEGKGKRHGGAIFFSGKSFICYRCEFYDNHVTGNGGAIYIEPFQPSRKLADPDLDYLAPSQIYSERIPHEKLGFPQLVQFLCQDCSFSGNNAMSIARGTGTEVFGPLTGGYGGALAISLGLRYFATQEVSSSTAVYSVSQGFGSNGKLDALVKNCTFIGNEAYQSGGAIYGAGGKTVSKQSSFKLTIIDSYFDENKAMQGSGGAALFTKGTDNGDYDCRNGNANCDSLYFGVQIKDTEFATNKQGKAEENNDVVGDDSISDEASAWRDVVNFGKACNAACCDAGTTCALTPGESTRCKVWPADTDGVSSVSYSCNDGIFLQGTSTTHRCSINAKSVTSCPAGYEYDLMPGSCRKCDAGKFQPFTTLNTESTFCQDCPPGKRSGTAATKCELCAAGTFQEAWGSVVCRQCGAEVENSQSNVVGGTSSNDCQCGPTFYDNRQNISDPMSKMNEPNHAIDNIFLPKRCVPCHPGANCTVSGQTLRGLRAKRGYWRASDVESKFYLCRDVMMPGSDPSSSVICTGGEFTNMCAKGRFADRKPNGTSIAPLCDSCGPFKAYVENAQTFMCDLCPEGDGASNLLAATNGLGLFMAFAAYAFFLHFMTAKGLMFKLLDSDDSGSIGIDELIGACRDYCSYTEEDISDERLKTIFRAFDMDHDGEIGELVFNVMWQHIAAEVYDPENQSKKLRERAVHAIEILLKKGSGHTVHHKKRTSRKHKLAALKDSTDNTHLSDLFKEEMKQVKEVGKESNSGGDGGGGGDDEDPIDEMEGGENPIGDNIDSMKEDANEKLNEVGESLKDGAAAVGNALKEGANAAGNALKEGAGALKDGAEAAGNALKDVGADAAEAAKNLGGTVAGAFTKGNSGDGEGEPAIEGIPDVVKHVRPPKLGPTFKIFFGWGQILCSFNLTFEIPWPASFDGIMNGMYAPFNLDIMKYFGPLGCAIQTDYVNNFNLHMATPMYLLALLIAAYITAQVWRKVAPRKPQYDSNTLKAKFMRLINLIVFVLYPGLGLKIFRVFDTVTYGQHKYMRADLSLRTDDPRYVDMNGRAWLFLVAYVLMIPISFYAILHRNMKAIAADPDDDTSIPADLHKEVMSVRTSFGSIYQDYRRRHYYWEIVEMVRKIVLVGALVLMSKGGMQIFVGVIICFIYVFMAAYAEPFSDSADQLLQYVTSVQIFITLLTGLMISYRSYEAVVMPDLVDPDKKDDVFMEFLLMLSTASVFGCIALVAGISLKDTITSTVLGAVHKIQEKKKQRDQMKLDKIAEAKLGVTKAPELMKEAPSGGSKYVIPLATTIELRVIEPLKAGMTVNLNYGPNQEKEFSFTIPATAVAGDILQVPIPTEDKDFNLPESP